MTKPSVGDRVVVLAGISSFTFVTFKYSKPSSSITDDDDVVASRVIPSGPGSLTASDGIKTIPDCRPTILPPKVNHCGPRSPSSPVIPVIPVIPVSP